MLRNTRSGSFLSNLAHAPARAHLIIVVAAALCLRAVLFITSCADPSARQLEEDSVGFVTLASNIADGKGYGRLRPADNDQTAEVWRPELTRPPGFSLVLAALGAREGQAVPVAVVAQHVLAVFLCVAATLTARRVFGPPAGLAAGLLLAFDVQGAALGNLVLTETLFGVLLFGAAVLTSKILSRSAVSAAAWSGLLLGAATIVKPTTIALCSIVAFVLAAISLRRRSRQLALAAVVLAIVGNAPVVGWILRNGLATGEYVFSSIPRYQLVAEHAAGALARTRDVPIEITRAELFQRSGISPTRIRYGALGESEEKQLRSLALTTIRDNIKGFVVESTIRSINMLFGPDKNVLRVMGLPMASFGLVRQSAPVTSRSPFLTFFLLSASLFAVGALYAMLLVAAFRLRPWRAAPTLAWVCLAFAAYVLGLSMGAPGDPRYRWPAVPLLAIVAAGALRSAPAVGADPRS